MTRLSIGLLLLFSGTFGFADVVYDDFGVGYSTEFRGIRWDYEPLIPGASSSIGAAALFPVPVGMTYRLDSVTLPLAHYSGATNLEVALFSDNGGAPGLLLETIAANPAGIGATPTLYTFGSSLSPVLDGGNIYWIVVQPHDLNVTDQTQNSSYRWNAAFFQLGNGATRDYDFMANDWGPWVVRSSEPLQAFRIEGTVVPEPSTWALFALGTALFWCAARRWKK